MLIAVLVHDFADGLNVVTLAFAGGRVAQRQRWCCWRSTRPRRSWASLIGQLDRASTPPTLGMLLGVFGGAFIAIGASHLLPEAQHREHASVSPLVALTIVGALVVLGAMVVCGCSSPLARDNRGR